ncbi:MAG TPA: Pvc16 family protein [Anaerolineaceae bacterium]
MIADLDETIRQLLIAEVPIKNNEVEISFDQPKREWSSKINKPTVNFFLYDLRENPVLRQHQWEEVPNNRRGTENKAHLKRTPLRVDCFYMLTTWANEAEDEHRLLSRILMTLFRFPILETDRLSGALKNQPFDVPARLANHDKLTNPAEVWSSLDNEMRPSISYVVTLAMDPWTEITPTIVQTFDFRTGQALNLPRKTGLVPGTENQLIYIGGTLRKQGVPLPEIEVAIKGTGFFARTDPKGRYAFGSIPAGEYTLVAWVGDGKPVEKKITVPTRGDNFDINL